MPADGGAEATAAAIAVVADPVLEPESKPEPDTEAPDYVPMSEWIEDFDRRAGRSR